MPSDNNLHKAAHKGDFEECKKLLESPDEPIDINEPGASDRRALQRAAGAGHLEICEYFVAMGAQIDLVSKLYKSRILCSKPFLFSGGQIWQDCTSLGCYRWSH